MPIHVWLPELSHKHCIASEESQKYRGADARIVAGGQWPEMKTTTNIGLELRVHGLELEPHGKLIYFILKRTDQTCIINQVWLLKHAGNLMHYLSQFRNATNSLNFPLCAASFSGVRHGALSPVTEWIARAGECLARCIREHSQGVGLQAIGSDGLR